MWIKLISRQTAPPKFLLNHRLGCVWRTPGPREAGIAVRWRQWDKPSDAKFSEVFWCLCLSSPPQDTSTDKTSFSLPEAFHTLENHTFQSALSSSWSLHGPWFKWKNASTKHVTWHSSPSNSVCVLSTNECYADRTVHCTTHCAFNMFC